MENQNAVANITVMMVLTSVGIACLTPAGAERLGGIFIVLEGGCYLLGCFVFRRLNNSTSLDKSFYCYFCMVDLRRVTPKRVQGQESADILPFVATIHVTELQIDTISDEQKIRFLFPTRCRLVSPGDLEIVRPFTRVVVMK